MKRSGYKPDLLGDLAVVGAPLKDDGHEPSWHKHGCLEGWCVLDGLPARLDASYGKMTGEGAGPTTSGPATTAVA